MNKGLLLILSLLVFILIIVVSVGLFVIYNKSNNNQNQEIISKVEKEENNGEAIFKANCDEYILNIVDSRGKTKLMKLSFSVKSSDQLIQTIIDNYKSEITDKIIIIMANKNSEDLFTTNGKVLLKDELLKEINLILKEDITNEKQTTIKSLFFKEFVIK